MEERELRGRPTLANQLARIESSNLRDLLKAREDEGAANAARRRPEAVTLATVLACEKRDLSSPSSSSASAAAVSGRTLLDVIRDEEEPNRLLVGAGQNGGNKVSWKAFKDRLRLRRATTAWSATSSSTPELAGYRATDEGEYAVADPGSPRAISVLEAATTTASRSGINFNSSSIASSSSSAAAAPHQRGNRSATEQPAPPQPPRTPQQQQEEPTRISLMALLEQSDRVANGGGGPSFAAAVMGLVEEDEEEEEEGEEAGAAVVAAVGGVGTSMNVCCVCMVRHKGAAFIPCGHTFCRLCSRELWISRGHCPLCNGFILEILDIF